jgi:hypothetical protein
VLAALLTAAALAATVLFWRRRWVFVIRPMGVLLTEVLLTLTVGLVVNRSQLFYPSWAALFASADPESTSYHTSAGRLDAWLAAQPGAGAAQSFPWRPAGWTGWHLAGPPTVTVPAGYLAHTSWRYSAVVAIGARPWAVPDPAGPTVLVSLTTTAATAVPTLALAVPGLLGRDLRVSGHRWALVASAADAALARKVAEAGRGRFPVLALVGVVRPAPAGPAATAAHPQHRVGVSKATGYDNSCPVVHTRVPPPAAKTKAAPRPAATHPVHGVGTSTAGGYDNSAPAVHNTATGSRCTPPGQLPTGIQTAYYPAPAIKNALTWAAAQTPPPLAASAPEPTYLPPQPRPRTRRTPTGGNHGSGQPRP